MTQKIEVDADSFYDLVYTWVVHVQIKQIPESMDKESFKRGAFSFMDKLHNLMSEEVSK